MTRPGIGWAGWTGAATAAVAVVLLVGALFRLPKPSTGPQKPAPIPKAPVGLVRLKDNEGGLLREDATLRDPTPLFLPTRWNAADNAVAAGMRREAGLSFGGYGAKLSFPNTALRLQLPAPVALPGRPADALAGARPSVPLQGLGETDEPAPSLAPRAAFVQVVAAGSGQLVFSQPLRDAQPPGDYVWQPMEFLIGVDRSGVVRPPVLTRSSRVPGVDAYFQTYLTATLHVGARLPPGFYRVGIGP